MNMIAEMNSTKPSFESSFFNESPLTFSNLSFFLQQQNNQQSNSGLFFSHLQQQQQQEEELEAPVNIYHEHRGHLEEDKKSRTKLDTEIADDDLYCPVQQPPQPQSQQRQQQPQENTSSGENFPSFLPRFLTTSFSTNNNSYNGIMESTNNDTWGCYHNDMFGTNNNMFGGFDGINSVACQ